MAKGDWNCVTMKFRDSDEEMLEKVARAVKEAAKNKAK